MEESTDSFLQITPAVSSDTLKDAFFNLGENISDFNGLKKSMVAVEITKRRGGNITEEGTMTDIKAEYGVGEGAEE